MNGALPDLMPGARNAVKFTGIRAGTEVLVGCTEETERESVAAVIAAIRALGASTSVIEIEAPGLNQPAPRALVEALAAVDHYVDMDAGPRPHTKDMYLPMYDRAVSMTHISTEPGFLTSEVALYPLDVWFEIHNHLKWSISKHQIEPGVNVTFHLTDDLGSDLTYRVKCPENIGCMVGAEPLSAGGWWKAPRPRILTRAQFPPDIMPMGDLQYSATGVLYVLASNYFGLMPEPWKLTFEQGYCVSIEGGELADRVWELTIGRYRNANRLREIAINLHPKQVSRHPVYDPEAPVPRAMLPGTGVGEILISLGGDTGAGGVDVGYENITTLFASSDRLSMTADGEPVVTDGRLVILEDPALRDAVSAFGDPDQLLAPAAPRERGRG